MKRVLVCAVLGPTFLVNVANAQSNSAIAEQIVRDGTSAYIDGAVNCKTSVLERLFASDFLMIHGGGQTMNKAALVTMFGRCASDTARMTIEPKTIKMFSEVVIMTGELSRFTKAGSLDGPFLVTMIFVKKDGTWQMLEQQSTFAASRSPAVKQ
jgi:hypothetical protein